MNDLFLDIVSIVILAFIFGYPPFAIWYWRKKKREEARDKELRIARKEGRLPPITSHRNRSYETTATRPYDTSNSA